MSASFSTGPGGVGDAGGRLVIAGGGGFGSVPNRLSICQRGMVVRLSDVGTPLPDEYRDIFRRVVSIPSGIDSGMPSSLRAGLSYLASGPCEAFYFPGTIYQLVILSL